MDKKNLEKLCIYISKMNVPMEISRAVLINKCNIPSNIKFPKIKQLNNELSKISKFRVAPTKNGDLLITLPQFSKNTYIDSSLPKWNGLKDGNKACAEYLAYDLLRKNKSGCTIVMAKNKLKAGNFFYYSFEDVIKETGILLKNNCSTELVIANGYLIPKHIESKKTIKTEVSKMDPFIKVNGETQDFREFRLFVYKSLNNLQCEGHHNHNSEDVTIQTCNYLGKPVSFSAFHCKNCEKYYTTISIIKKYYPFVYLKFNDSVYKTDDDKKIIELNEQSELNYYGYNVQKDGNTTWERQNLLANLLYYKIMTKEKIINVLTFLIKFNSSKSTFVDAEIKWQDDLEFIQDFGLDDQKKIIVKEKLTIK